MTKPTVGHARFDAYDKASQDAARPLGASGYYIGVQHGNAPSPCEACVKKDALIERLKQYTEHHKSCGYDAPRAPECTCGLSELLKECK